MGLTIQKGRVESAQAGPYSQYREAAFSIQRALEDLQWESVSVDERAESGYASMEERKDVIRRARRMIKRNPLAKQAASLLVNYVLGRGVTLTAANRSVVARLVDELWDNSVNKAVFTSNQAMADFIVGAFTDGAQFLVLFPDKEEGTLELGWLDPLYVEDIIMDPENVKVAKWIKVRKPKRRYDFKGDGQWDVQGDDEISWYRFWQNDDGQEDEPKGKRKKKDEDEEKTKHRATSRMSRPPKVADGLVYIARRGRGKFGTSEVAAAEDWLAAHKSFMEDRATLTRAAASIAWKKKRKNAGSVDVNAEVSRLRSSLANPRTLGYESNPPSSAASTVVENENSNLEWVKTDTGGSAALADERILRMMAGSGMGGIPNHYFGDEADANLASATSMELPLLKQYESWQQWLTDIIGDIIEFALETAHEAGRLGERDDEARYTDRSLTSERVMEPPEQMPLPGQTPPLGQQFGEAEAVLPIQSGNETPLAPVTPGPDTPTKNGKPDPLMAPLKPVTFSVRGDEPKKSDKVDWYVDVDFPPIVVKDLFPHFEALRTLGEFLPPDNPEGQRLLLQQALNALGVNDTNQVIDNLFPPLPPGVQPTMPQPMQPQMLGMGQQQGLLPARTGIMGNGGGQPPQPVPGAPRVPVAETMPPVRMHRFIEAVRLATERP